MTKRTLAKVIAEMKDLLEEPDLERAHVKADDLLIEALLILDGNGTKALRADFARLPKWYA